MYTASFRFYAELNDFLPTACRQAERELRFHGQPAVKDAIESLGVPHTEVDLILINGAVAGFTDLLHHGDRVSVYPVFESLDIGAIARLRPRPLREPRFILDVHLGRLATFLRLLGFDAEYANSYDDLDLAERSIQDERILLTRDRGLLKRAEITRGYCVRSEDPKSQIREVVARFDLLGCLHPFTRCLVCNGILEDVPKAEVVTSLPTRVSELNERFTRCGGCGRVFWEGTHFERLNRFVEAIVAEASLKGGEG